MPTSIAEWRQRNRPEEVELPSGCVALLRKVHILDLAMSGQIPGTLMAEAAAMEKSKPDDWLQIVTDPKKAQQWLGIIDPVVKATFVEPKVGDEPSDEQLGIGEIEMADKLAIFRWANEGAQRLSAAGFRVKSGDAVGAAPGGEHVREPAEPDPGAG